MGAIRDLWDLLDPVLPTRVKDWGEAISDAADDIGTSVQSDDVRTIDQVTQAEYDALTPDADTLYVVVD